MTPVTENSARKFTFDTEFSGSENRPTPAARARQKQTLTTEELESLKAGARSEGENNAGVRAAEALERTIAALTITIRAALDNSHAQVEALRAEAAELALAMAKRIAPAALAALPAGDVEIALRQAMHQAIGEPRITLRAAPVVFEALEARLTEIAHEEGYEGRVMIVADAAMTGADCRIEWRGGGAERREQAIEDALTALIAHRFSHNEDLKG
ncbi:MAG: flbE protein [Alphaproteobacteria bacterium]|jgi:flagellar assembly protein FliH|nr:flbE protein [Alphaproteobacteria bacterium]